MQYETIDIKTLDKISRLNKLNKKLKEENKILKEWKEDLLNENIELENIRKEAIEYIETHQLNFKKGITTFGSERLSMEERKLLDILQRRR